MKSLCYLAEKYGTDKFKNYTPFYDTLLRSHRDRVLSVLEIGIGTTEAMRHVENYSPGASLRMWRDYFPNAHVIGIDRDPAVLFSEDRITTLQGDQKTPHSILNSLSGASFDLIVDDGSHNSEHQLQCATVLHQLLAPGGYYIIEDVHHFHEVSEQLRLPHSCVECHYSTRFGRLILIEA